MLKNLVSKGIGKLNIDNPEFFPFANVGVLCGRELWV